MITMVPLNVHDPAQLEQWVALTEAVRRADCAWQHPADVRAVADQIRYGHDLEPGTHFLFYRHRPAPVAAGWVFMGEWDNLDSGWMSCWVHPEERRNGVGTQVLGLICEHVKAAGRTRLGTNGWESPAVIAFADKHGWPQLSVSVNRRHYLAEVPSGLIDSLAAEAFGQADDYGLRRLAGPVPDDLMASYLVALGALNDAPTDGLEVEDEVFNAERARNYEEACRLKNERLYRLLAIHNDTGEVAGISGVGVDGYHPDRGHQHDTEVVPAHRGHRLGLLLKTEMVRWLAQAEPQLRTIDTWNAESNSHMIAVNDRLGYRINGRSLQFQKTL